MKAMNCLILEDEPLAVNILIEYISEIPGLELKAVCEDAFAALKALRTEKIDILFVDINLPKLSGIEFIKALKDEYSIILTTAYHEFALEAYGLNVLDYLLKPIEFSRFLQAVNKVLNLTSNNQPSSADNYSERTFYFFNVDKKKVKLFSDEIVYVESLKDYVKIHLENKHIVTKFHIGSLYDALKKNRFARIHKSYLINVDKISSFNSTEVELGLVKLPIGRMYKGELEARIAINVHDLRIKS